MDNLDLMLKSYLRSAATPFCLELLSLVEQGKWNQVVRMRVDPKLYTNAEAYIIDAQAIAFFSKRSDLSHPALDPRQAATDAWWEAEQRCALTNTRMLRIEYGPSALSELRTWEFFQGVQKRLRSWLGPAPKSLDMRFGPGSTICCTSLAATVADKMSKSPTTTADAWFIAKHCLEETSWFRSLLERGILHYEGGVLSGETPVRASRWACVPKNAKTHRSIEVGPNVNVALQLAVGSEMKRRFAQRGWDLLHAADVHREMARSSSRDKRYSTIDLKQASDSVSRRLVERLLPPDWLDITDHLRVPFISMEGKTIWLEKYSGMGNGYTFELESVIFMSVAQEVCHHLGLPCNAMEDVFVFGDDIIVPTEAANLLIKVLREIGFETNVDKTFVDGPFRESCGGDYFEGQAVRPFFLKESPNEPQDWISFANGLYRLATDDIGNFRFHHLVNSLRLRVLDAIPSTIRCLRGPQALGDIVIHDEPSTWIIKIRDCIRYIRCYRPAIKRTGLRNGGAVVEWDNFHDSVKLATILLGQGVSGRVFDSTRQFKLVDLGIIPRNPRLSYKTDWVTFS